MRVNSNVKTLRKAIERAGGVSAMSRHLAVSRQAVQNWLKRGGTPPEYCVRIEDMTGVKCHELRPDVFRTPLHDAESRN